MVGAVAVAAAAALVAILVLPRDRFRTRVVRGPEVLRTQAAALGDRWELDVRPSSPQDQLWVYYGDRELVAHCAADRPCEGSARRWRASIELTAVGTYAAAYVSSAAALPAPSGLLDADLAAARSAGGTVDLRQLEVR